MNSKVHLFFSYGFRPFFSMAVLFAGLSALVWVAAFAGLYVNSGELNAMTWHAHEMMFGYLAAVLAGFTLTAVANWTGRPPVSGMPLILLFIVWLAGRIAMALALTGHIALAPAVLVDVLFIPLFAATFGREVIAGGNKRNLVVVAAVSVFGLANVLFCLNALALFDNDYWVRLGLGAAAALIALIGGRIIPAFTMNWLTARGLKLQMPEMDLVDKIALVLTVLGAILWTALPDAQITAFTLVIAGAGLAVRLGRWHGLKTLREPLMGALHLGYALLAVSLVLIGLGIWRPNLVPPSSGLHLLTAGAIGLMTCVVMIRALLGHTGRPLIASTIDMTALVLIAAGAILRAATPFTPDLYMPLVALSGIIWSGGFLLLAAHFGPMAIRPRLTWPAHGPLQP